MEYFNNGSLQFQIDNKRIFTEEVWISFIFV
jgi:hypothetical protein